MACARLKYKFLVLDYHHLRQARQLGEVLKCLLPLPSDGFRHDLSIKNICQKLFRPMVFKL